jgi:CHAT domain-containing protein/Tfp pilus assembly protein PilF
VGYSNVGEKEKALELFNQALQLNRELKLRKREASTLNNIGDLYKDKGDTKKAIEFFNQALPLWRLENDKSGEAKTLGNMAIIYLRASDFSNARDYFTKALTLSREAEDIQTEITSLAYLGDVYHELEDIPKALESYKEVLTKAHNLGARPLEISMLNQIGYMYQLMGDLKLAVDSYTKALNLSQQTNNKRGEASAYLNNAAVYQDLGDMQKALDFIEKSLVLYKETKDQRGEAEALNNTGTMYESLGDYEKAIDYYNKALPLFIKLGYTQGEARIYNNLGIVYEALGKFDKAIESYEKAIPLYQKIQDRPGLSTTLSNLGAVYSLDLNQQEKALTYFQQALTLAREAKSLSDESTALRRIGIAYLNLSELDKAFENLTQALKIEQKTQDRHREADTRFALSQTELNRGNYESALGHAEKTFGILESIRSSVANPKLRSTYLASIQNYYSRYIEILMFLHKKKPNEDWSAKALEANERARARGLLELLSEVNVNIRQGVDEKLIETERNLRQRISVRTDARVRLLNSKHTKEQEEKINKEIKELTDEYEKIEAQIRTTSPRYAALAQPQPLTLTDIQKKVLDKDTILLEYALGAERSFLWVVTQDSISSYELPKRAEIKKSAETFFKIISSRPTAATKKEYETAAKTLSDILLKPAAIHLQNNKRLLIVSDGVLQYIPFAVLSVVSGQSSVAKTKSTDNGRRTTDNKPLIVEHEIISLPSASTVAVLRDEKNVRPKNAKEIMVVADPVFEASDLRIKRDSQTNSEAKTVATNKDRALQSFLRTLNNETNVESAQPIPRLSYTRREALTIAALVPKTQSKIYLDFDANYANATNAEAGQYRFIHFGTHGLLNSEQPELTGILFSMIDEKGNPQSQSLLRLGEVYNLKLPVELVVLSGCQTAIGKEIKGEGLVGLTRGFMYAGSPRVVASLWKVDDAMTAEVMKHFYQAMLGAKRLAPAAALRQAQKEMLRQKIEPFYWAAFIMQGEWR